MATGGLAKDKIWPVRVFAYSAGYVRGMPRWLKVTMAVLLVGCVVLGGYYLIDRRAKTNAANAEREAWRLFEEAVRSGDWPGMDAALGEVLKVRPGDPLATARRASLATNDSAINDQAMPRLTLRKALRDGNLVAAEREARKLLAHTPSDWLAHCVLANAALAEGDRVGASAEVDLLKNPGAAESGVQPGILLLAFDLHRRLGRDPSSLRQFVRSNVARALKSQLMKNLPPGERLGAVECYLLGFEPGDALQPTPIVEGYVPARELVAAAAADAAALPEPAPILARAARLGPALELAATQFARRGQITDAQLTEFVADDRDRTARLWEDTLARDPKSPEAYRNLAAIAARRGHGEAALGFLTRGLAACPDDPTLGEIQSRVLREQGRGVDAARLLAASARAHPRDQIWWRLAVEAARLAARADLALELLAESRALRPGEPWTVVADAELRLSAGDAAAAAKLLGPLGVESLAADTRSLRAAAHAFAAGDRTRLADLAAAAEVRAVQAADAEPLTALVAGLTDGPADEARLADAAARGEDALRRFPGEPELLRLVALAQFRRAELSDWSRDPVARAEIPTVRFLAARPEDREAAVWLASLRLYGEGRPEQALRDLEPVRRAEAAAGPRDLALLGEALRRSGSLAGAVRVLKLAAERPRPGAGVFVQLAIAHQAAGDAAEARAALARAQSLPRSPREQADYAAAAKTLY